MPPPFPALAAGPRLPPAHKCLPVGGVCQARWKAGRGQWHRAGDAAAALAVLSHACRTLLQIPVFYVAGKVPRALTL